jgi:hypothetical protein
MKLTINLVQRLPGPIGSVPALRAGAGDLRLLQLFHLGNAASRVTSPTLIKFLLALWGVHEMRNATMRDPRGLLRGRWFEASDKRRTIALIAIMIKDFDNMIGTLDKQIVAEEDRTRIRDTEHPAYSRSAKAMAKQRENLLVSEEQMKSMLDVLKCEHLVVTLPVAQSRADPEQPATDSAY